MEAISLFQQSRLDEAIASLSNQLRQQPADLDLRYAMAGLVAFAGDFDRALVHLDFIAAENPALATAVAMYTSSMHAEEERRRIYATGHVPGTDRENEQAVKRRVQLRQQLRAGDAGAAATTMATIAAEPVANAAVDGAGVAAARFADMDEGFGAVLEIFVGGRCLWVPTQNLRSLEFVAPRGLLDLLWAQCAITTTAGVRYSAHLPVLYHGTHARSDAQVRCGHKTEWHDELGVAFRGYGARVFTVGDREVGILELRKVQFAASGTAG
ncbi:MAG: hypothetical protein JNK78_01220 [Planctomycetes bacterium]|nr:hypothetical protein [Planctomycetota bacterium]